MVRSIRRLAGAHSESTPDDTVDDDSLDVEKVAIAYYYEKRKHLRLKDLRNWSTLIITHEAYRRAVGMLPPVKQTLAEKKQRKRGLHDGKWKHFAAFGITGGGQRRNLKVIDECLDLCETGWIEYSDAEFLRGALKLVLEDRPAEAKAFDWLMETFDRKREIYKDNQLYQSHVSNLPKSKYPADFKALMKQVLKAPYHKISRGYDRKLLFELLGNLTIILSNDKMYYEKVKGQHICRSSRLLLPEGDHEQAILLDGTGRENPIYGMYTGCFPIDPPCRSRDYGNLTIYTSSGHAVGKTGMEQHGRKFLPRLAKAVFHWQKNPPEILFFTHMDAEKHLKDNARLKAYMDKRGWKYQVEHWGRHEGQNRFRDLEQVVIASLWYFPDSWVRDRKFALEGGDMSVWNHAEGKKQIDKIRRQQVAVECVQACQRIRSRKPINSRGECLETKVYLMLSEREDENAFILNSIKKLLPNVNIEPDTFEFPTEKQVKLVRQQKSEWDKLIRKEERRRFNKSEAKIFDYLEGMLTDVGFRLTRGEVLKAVNISKGTMKLFIKKAKDVTTDVYTRLADELGIKLEIPERIGRGVDTWFIKVR
jgi:hypothetical protein